MAPLPVGMAPLPRALRGVGQAADFFDFLLHNLIQLIVGTIFKYQNNKSSFQGDVHLILTPGFPPRPSRGLDGAGQIVSLLAEDAG